MIFKNQRLEILMQTVQNPSNRSEDCIILNGEKLFKVNGAAKELGVTKGTLYNLNSQRKIGYYRAGKECFYSEKHLLDYLKENEFIPQSAIMAKTTTDGLR